MTRPIELILSKLDKIRNRGPDSWMAACPAHQDKNPSLSIKEQPDGTVLCHCFAGCGVDDVLGALGLELGDLFNKPLSAPMTAPTPGTFTAADVLAALVGELEDLCLEPDAARLALARDMFLDAQDFIKGLT
jgi:hypothetical protein